MTGFAKSVFIVAAVVAVGACSDDDIVQQQLDGPKVVPDAFVPPADTRAPDTGPAPDLGPKSVSCTPPGCPACVDGKTGCAASGPFLTGTCCARGDNLVRQGTAWGSEVVDLETDGKIVVACGGFGATISDVSDPRAASNIGNVTQRCQRIAIGPTLSDGTKVVYLAHHGDSWVNTPFLSTVYISGAGGLKIVNTISDDQILFEGLLYHGGKLYVAAHEGGLRTYDVSKTGVPSFKHLTTDGIKNAWKLAGSGNRLFVADQKAGLHVFALTDPLKPVRAYTVATTAAARDVAVDGTRAFVAMGGGGIDVFDISDAKAAPKRVKTVAGLNSAQAVEVSNGVLAVAAWNHTAMYDAKSLTLLATERTRKAFEQDLGVAMHKDIVMVGEWEGVHIFKFRPGYIAPDLFVTEDIFTMAPDLADSRAVLVQNLGFDTLKVSGVTFDSKAFTVKNGSFNLAPGKSEVFEFNYKPPSGTNFATMTIASNDPDPNQAKLAIRVDLKQVGGIGVGSSLTSSFGFLDPSGAGQVSGLKGKVTILAYFALF